MKAEVLILLILGPEQIKKYHHPEVGTRSLWYVPLLRGLSGLSPIRSSLALCDRLKGPRGAVGGDSTRACKPCVILHPTLGC